MGSRSKCGHHTKCHSNVPKRGHKQKRLGKDHNVKSNDATYDFHAVEEHQLEEDNESIATVEQEVIADEVKSQVPSALAADRDIVEGPVEQLFCSAALSAQGGIHSVV